MTQTTIRAIAHDGLLKPIDAVELEEGKEYQITISDSPSELTRDEIIDRLKAAGLLTEFELGEGEEPIELSEEERDRIGRILGAAGNSLDWVNKEREERF